MAILMSASADLKIGRANHHREQLLADLQAFRDREPYVIRERIEERGAVTYRVVSAEDAEQPPDQIALVLGDFIQNLRSSLDHVVGAIRADGPSKDSAFPICFRKDGDAGFDRVSIKKLAGIPEAAKDIIESMQPYVPADGDRDWHRDMFRPLGILHTLWNIDKHRSILLSTTLVRPKYIGHNRTTDEPSGIGHRLAAAGGIAEWWLPVDERDQAFDPHFGIEVSLTRPIGFADDWPPEMGSRPLDGLVEQLYRTVAFGAVPRLREFMRLTQ